MPDMIHDTITLPRRVVELAVSCIVRAEAKGVFKDCGLPTVGAATLARLEAALRDGD